MSRYFSILYYDRYSHKYSKEDVYADKFLFWLYNTNSGLLMNDLFFKRKIVSKLYKKIQNSRLSKNKIPHFIKRYSINTSELQSAPEKYKSFNDFFKRKIDLLKRPVNSDSSVCIAPCDGRALAYHSVNQNTTFKVKRHTFDLKNFLRNESLINRFSECSLYICRLHLSDYHHFHFPDSGIADESIAIDGHLFTSGPYSLSKFIPFYTENFRVITPFKSENFGDMLICEIGAFTVGSVKQEFLPGEKVKKGDHKGYFEIGGSTIALLFQKGKINFDDDLLSNTENGIETYIKMGDSIGKGVKNVRKE